MNIALTDAVCRMKQALAVLGVQRDDKLGSKAADIQRRLAMEVMS